MHAIPASDAEEYEGMPLLAEVGPIELDPKIQIQVDELLATEPLEEGKNKEATLAATLDKCHGDKA